jgi:N6-L-threonylcarbamoyladenine synthase
MTSVLGIETSCDETAIALVNSSGTIIFEKTFTQDYTNYGGVIPELAARNHMEILPKLLSEALQTKQVTLESFDAIAVTSEPGLIGGLLVGVVFAKTLGSLLNKPVLPINHLEGHLLTARLTNPELEFPYLTLLLSGGHCQIIYAKKLGEYLLLGETRDDALGEAFDKVGRLLGLEYPGGPAVEKLAKLGQENIYQLPKAFYKEKHADFSFSGLKTAVARQLSKEESSDQIRANLAASFQKTVADILQDRLQRALEICQEKNLPLDKVVLAGGVAANLYLKEKLSSFCEKFNKSLITPPIRLCTDNGVMIAWAGLERFLAGERGNYHFSPQSRSPLHKTAKLSE